MLILLWLALATLTALSGESATALVNCIVNGITARWERL
jgi:hypothetical protein